MNEPTRQLKKSIYDILAVVPSDLGWTEKSVRAGIGGVVLVTPVAPLDVGKAVYSALVFGIDPKNVFEFVRVNGWFSLGMAVSLQYMTESMCKYLLSVGMPKNKWHTSSRLLRALINDD